jgi:hypothetical protein
MQRQSRTGQHANGTRPPRFPYYRFSGENELGRIPMDQWNGRRFSALRRGTPGSKTLRAYIKIKTVQNDMEELAELLVRRRRLRTRDASKWDRYASASWYISLRSMDAKEDLKLPSKC